MPLRDMNRERMWLLPPSLDELLPLDHPARFVAEFVDALDKEGWAELGVEIEGDPLGAPAYHPRALLSVWLYGFMTGMRSCRKLEAACRDQIPYLWLTGWQYPDHNTLWRFYKGHRRAMRKLFERTVRTAVTMKLVDLAVQAVDGTKVGANAAGDRTYDAEDWDGYWTGCRRPSQTWKPRTKQEWMPLSPICRRSWRTRGPCENRCAGRWTNSPVEKATSEST